MSEQLTPSPEPGKPEGTPQVPTGAGPDDVLPEPGTPNSAPADEVAALQAELEKVKADYGASSREAQVLIEQIKAKDAQISQLTTPHNPTDDDLRAAYPEWDSMLPTEQRLARENYSLRKGQANTQKSVAELQAEIAWGKDLKKLLKKPDFAGLKGREDEFEEYVFKPHHKGIPTETLARSFLFGLTPTAAAAPAPAPSAPTGERGSGGPPPTSSKKKLTLEEAKTLRETTFEEYRRQLAAGNIDDEI